MRNGLVLFSSDRGITPAGLARAGEERGFDTIYVPEHTHIPVRADRRAPGHRGRVAAGRPLHAHARPLGLPGHRRRGHHEGSGSRRPSRCPSSRTRSRSAKAIATLDHLSGGRVTIGAGFGWDTDELEDHHVPAGKRRTVLREYVEAMRALWTQEEASYDGEFVSFGPSWAYPKPVQAHIPLIIGAGGGPKTFQWIARHADGWMSTPTQTDIGGQIEALKSAWTDEGREGHPGHPGPDRLPPRSGRPGRLGRRRRLRADLGRAGQVRGRGARLPRQAGRPTRSLLKHGVGFSRLLAHARLTYASTPSRMRSRPKASSRPGSVPA